MSPLHAQELHALPSLMNQAAQAAIATLQALPERPAAVRSQPVPRQPFAEQAPGLPAALQDFEQRYAPSFAASAWDQNNWTKPRARCARPCSGCEVTAGRYRQCAQHPRGAAARLLRAGRGAGAGAVAAPLGPR